MTWICDPFQNNTTHAALFLVKTMESVFLEHMIPTPVTARLYHTMELTAKYVSKRVKQTSYNTCIKCDCLFLN